MCVRNVYSVLQSEVTELPSHVISDHSWSSDSLCWSSDSLCEVHRS